MSLHLQRPKFLYKYAAEESAYALRCIGFFYGL